MDTFLGSLVASRRPSLARRAGVALVTLVMALGLSLLFRLLFGTGTFLLFFGAVAIIAAHSGLRIGLLSVFVSLVLLNAFDFPPFDSLAITPDAAARVGIFVFVTSLIGWLGEARRTSERQLAIVLERERAVQQRTALLAELGIAMTSSLDDTTTLQQLARTVVPSFADFCIVYVLQPTGMIEQAVVVHRDGEVEARLHAIDARDSIDPAGPNAVATVLRTGESEVTFALSASDAQARTNSDEQRQTTAFLHPHASIVMPLIARGRTLGAISFAMAQSGRSYTQDDVALAEEIARRAALAMENAQLYRQAQDALRLREQFLTIAAHELKTPLTTLIGQGQLMQRRAERDGEMSARARRSLSIMNDQLRRLNHMVRALLDISRIETGQLSVERIRLDICGLVRQVVSEVQVSVEDRQIEVVCPDAPLMVLGDALRLEQVLLNLIQNALNYSQPPAPTIVTVQQEDEHAAIAVKDHGIGIPAAARAHLFTRFYRAENAETQHSGGMGIGLAVVKEIVVLHSGDVEVESVEGEGSTFTIRLPLAIDKAIVNA